MDRSQKQIILQDLQKKMVFLVGPRQVGKTWLAKNISEEYRNPLYLNYDHVEDRRIIEEEAWLDDVDLLILDELHKMSNWKNYLKGVFDTQDHLHILVTGSARLETFRQVGDSLAGRYFAHRLLPFTLSEYEQLGESVNFSHYLKRGGFPEPLFAETDALADRWRMQYADSLIRTDILDFERVHDLKSIQLLVELLKSRVGSPISYSSLAEDLQIAPNTVKRYVQILESLFVVFRVIPFSKNIARSLLKEPKLYFFDTGMVKGDDGAKLENMVAVSLYKYVKGQVDIAGKEMTLNYLRTKDGKEVDFCLACDDVPTKLIEVKLSNKDISKQLRYFYERYSISSVQIVQHLKRQYQKDGIEVRQAEAFLKTLIVE